MSSTVRKIGKLAVSWSLVLVGGGVASAAPVATPEPTPTASAPPGLPSADRGAAEEERLGIHGQSTFIAQYHPAFRSPYVGPLSLDPASRAEQTMSVSVFVGGRLWPGAEFYVNPELLQGFGLSNSTGIAGFTNGEAFKVGTRDFIGKLSRVLLRQTWPLGDTSEAVAPAANQLAGKRPIDRITLTVGKYAVVDIFDDNRYAHDSRGGFLNWTINDLGAFDMASPAFNYTYGAALEWYRAWWTVRAGFFLEPTFPNSQDIDTSFRQFQPLLELEERHEPGGHPGKLKLLLFGKRVEAGRFSEAVALAETTGDTPNTALVRHGLVWGYGGGLNLEQQITPNLGVFARASVQAGAYEEFSFTQVQQSVSAGLASSGARWSRDDDVVGLGLVANGLFEPERAYLAAGGTGIIIGDGALDYGLEEIVEIYYKLVPREWLAITVDYQLINHPAYNRARGPVSVFGLRVHLEY